METRRKSAKVVASVLALAGLVAFSVMGYAGSLAPSAPPAPTMKTLDEVEPRVPIHASDLPLTITESNSYYLVEDINFTSTANHGITIECNDVTIDLMGYTLKGPDSGIQSGIYMYGRTNVEIRNGTVRDFYRGVYESSSLGRQHRLINVRLMSNEYYGVCLTGYGNLVKDCTAADNSTYGIYVNYGSTVTGNTAYNNVSIGIVIGAGSTVTGNTAYNNVPSGISTGPGCTVTGNTAYDNGTDGIYANPGCRVTGNTCYDNGYDGIFAGAGSTVTGNTAYNNGYSDSGTAFGIWADSGSTVTGNTAYNNAEYGIYAVSYCLVDQNTAHGNGTNMVTGTECQVGLNVAP